MKIKYIIIAVLFIFENENLLSQLTVNTYQVDELEGHSVGEAYHDNEENLYVLSCYLNNLNLTKLNLEGITIWQKHIKSFTAENEFECGFTNLAWDHTTDEIIISTNKFVSDQISPTVSNLSLSETFRLDSFGNLINSYGVSDLNLDNVSSIRLVSSNSKLDYYTISNVYYSTFFDDASFFVQDVSFKTTITSFDILSGETAELNEHIFIPENTTWDATSAGPPTLFVQLKHNSTDEFFDVKEDILHNYDNMYTYKINRFDWEGNVIESKQTEEDEGIYPRLTNSGLFNGDYLEFSSNSWFGNFFDLNDSLLLYEDLLINTNTQESIALTSDQLNYSHSIINQEVVYDFESGVLRVMILDVTNSVISNEIDSKINIFPNPTNDFIEIDVNEIPLRIEILNLSGQLIQSETKNEIDINTLTSGIYLLKVVFSNGHEENRKFTKL